MPPPLTSRALNRRMAGAGLVRRPARGGGAGLSAAPGPSPEVPETIANLFAWWRADIDDVAIATGVSTWLSKVNGHVLTQAIGANQPAWTTSAALGGRNVLSFDGTNDRLADTGAAARWKFFHDGTGMTFFIAGVMNRATSSFNMIMGTGTNSTASTGLILYNNGPATNTATLRSANGGAWAITSGGSTGDIVGLKSIFDVSYKESSSPEFALRRQAANVVTGSTVAAPSSADPTHTLHIGAIGDGSAFGQIDIAEIIIYNAELSAGDKTAVYNYLDARYT